MKLTERERVIVVCLPALAVVLIYALWFMGYGPGSKLRQIRKQIAGVADRLSPADIAAETETLISLDRQLKTAEAKKAELEHELAQLRRRELEPPEQVAATKALTAMFHRHHLMVVSEGPQSSAQGVKLPQALTAAFGGKPGESPAGAAGHLRTYKLIGPFANLRAAVEELAEDETPPGIAVSLAMEEADGTTPHRVWTLFVWL